MAGITLEQAQTQLDIWLAADAAVAESQSYTINGKTLTRADAAVISEKIDRWDKQVKRLTRGGIRVRGGTPV